MVKSTGCSSTRPRFDSQLLYHSSQLPIIPIPGDSTPSDDLLRYCTTMAHRHKFRQNTYPHKVILN